MPEPIVEPERWMPIPGHEVSYEVSDRGRVRNIRNGRVLKPNVSAQGYFRVRVERMRTIHTLVLEAFIGPRPPGFVCRHLDGNHVNNWLGNLTWGTPSENCIDRERHGMMTEAGQRVGKKLNTADIDQIRRRHRDGEPSNAIARTFGISSSHASDIIRGKAWSWYVSE